MRRILSAYQFHDIQIFSITSVLEVTAVDDRGTPCTRVRRIGRTRTNLDRLGQKRETNQLFFYLAMAVITGLLRFAEAILTASGIAGGFILASMLMNQLWGVR